MKKSLSDAHDPQESKGNEDIRVLYDVVVATARQGQRYLMDNLDRLQPPCAAVCEVGERRR